MHAVQGASNIQVMLREIRVPCRGVRQPVRASAYACGPHGAGLSEWAYAVGRMQECSIALPPCRSLRPCALTAHSHCSLRSSLTSHQFPGSGHSMYLSCALTNAGRNRRSHGHTSRGAILSVCEHDELWSRCGLSCRWATAHKEAKKLGELGLNTAKRHCQATHS